MSVERLEAARTDALRAAPFTYVPVGHSRTGAPDGFTWFERSTMLRRRDFDAVARELSMWRLQDGSGLRVRASEAPLTNDTVVLMGLGVGRLSLRIPCRVVYVVDEADLRGFAYGTLPGHPESGEERFVVRRHDDGRIELTVSGFSRPASVLARLGGPLSRGFQSLMTGRYLRALDA